MKNSFIALAIIIALCYTHAKKWHPCPTQPKSTKEVTK